MSDPSAGPSATASQRDGARPRLSICLSTYNRASLVGATLDSIVPQLTGETELVILDGGSTDETPEITRRVESLSLFVRYVRLPENLGFDRDFCKAVEAARGEYCWLFADDDLIDAGAVGRVLAEVRGGYDVLIVNARAMDRDVAVSLKDSLLDLAADEVLGPGDLDRLFTVIVPYISFVGGLVIRREVWSEREKERYLGTDFVHVGVIFQAPLARGAKVLSRPDITIRCGNAQWSPRAVEVWLKSWPSLLLSFDSISDGVKRKMVSRWSVADLKRLVVYRGIGSYSSGGFGRLIAHEVIPLWWRLLARGVAWLPAPLVNALLLPYHRVFRRRDWFTIHELSVSRNNWFRRFLRRTG